jgi:hypothetical protein
VHEIFSTLFQSLHLSPCVVLNIYGAQIQLLCLDHLTNDLQDSMADKENLIPGKQSVFLDHSNTSRMLMALDAPAHTHLPSLLAKISLFMTWGTPPSKIHRSKGKVYIIVCRAASHQVTRTKKPLTCRIVMLELGIFVTPVTEIPQTPVPPYRQTPAPVTVSQNYMYRLVLDHWDAEIKWCEEARKAHLLEVQLAAHGICKFV